MNFQSVVSACKDIESWHSNHLRPLEVIKHIVIHRQSMAQSGTKLAQWFHDEGYKHTQSRRMSYHFFIRANGLVEQCVPLNVVTPGAYGMNKSGIQIAFFGDFRAAPPTKEQWASGVELVALLQRAFLNADVVAHDPEKPCPGEKFHIGAFKREVEEFLETSAKNTLKLKGIIL